MGQEFVGFHVTSLQLKLEKFTVVIMGFKRQESMHELLAGLNGLNKMDRVCIKHETISTKNILNLKTYPTRPFSYGMI